MSNSTSPQLFEVQTIEKTTLKFFIANYKLYHILLWPTDNTNEMLC